jgi:PhzF family phenazine biosynthesis protein
MPTLPFFQVDAFADRPFSGNPAAVCPTDGPLPEALMQDIAAENNLSETAFFHRQGDAFSLRWFTPTVEVDLCGHATLASAFVLMTALEPGRSEVVFRTRSGSLPVRRDGDRFVLDFPSFPAAPAAGGAPDAVASALGARPAALLRARAWLAVFAGAGDVARLAPDMDALARLDTSVCVTAPGGDGDARARGADFVSRYFAPGHGVPEDPVTGSAFCTLGPYWAARLGRTSLRGYQLSRRGGRVTCELAGDRVLIGGEARLVIQGSFHY